MKVGDLVKLSDGRVGVIVRTSTRTEPDGNPNGDFLRIRSYAVNIGSDCVWAEWVQVISSGEKNNEA